MGKPIAQLIKIRKFFRVDDRIPINQRGFGVRVFFYKICDFLFRNYMHSFDFVEFLISAWNYYIAICDIVNEKPSLRLTRICVQMVIFLSLRFSVMLGFVIYINKIWDESILQTSSISFSVRGIKAIRHSPADAQHTPMKVDHRASMVKSDGSLLFGNDKTFFFR